MHNCLTPSARKDAMSVPVVLCCGLLSLSILVPVSAAAQAAPPPPPPKQEGTAELAYVGATGNSSTNTLSVSGEHIFRPSPWLIKNRVAYLHDESDGLLSAETFLYSFRTERQLSPRLSTFGDYTYFKDEFSGVNHRNSLLGGVNYKLIEQAAHRLAVDAGLGYLNEQRPTDDDISSGTYGFGSTYKWTISPTSTLDDEARYIGVFDSGDNWRFSHVISLTTRITSLFSLKASNTIRHQHKPPIGFLQTDTTTSIALVMKFTRQ